MVHTSPGINLISVSVFGLPPDVVGASLGDIGVESVGGIALGVSGSPFGLTPVLTAVS